MKRAKPVSKDLYYTNDHEWIGFQGAVAYIGICRFKLSGFKEIHHVDYREASGLKKRGEVIAVITYHDYQVEAHMPVDGKIIQLNDALLAGDREVLLRNPESSGWIALIVPSQPYERKDLLLPKQYQMNDKDKPAR